MSQGAPTRVPQSRRLPTTPVFLRSSLLYARGLDASIHLRPLTFFRKNRSGDGQLRADAFLVIMAVSSGTISYLVAREVAKRCR